MIEAEWKEHTVTSGTDQLVYTTIFVYFYLSKFVLDKSITYTYVSIFLQNTGNQDPPPNQFAFRPLRSHFARLPLYYHHLFRRLIHSPINYIPFHTQAS